MAHRLIQADQSDESIELLKKAIEIFPFVVSENSPYSMLVEIYEKQEDRQKLMASWKRRRFTERSPSISKSSPLAGLISKIRLLVFS